jgi:hypothetical protein
MRATVRGMTLQTLLRQHGISTIKELTHRTGLSRQQCWNLWHAKTGVGKATAKRLHEQLGIPAEQLLQVDPVPARTPGRRGPSQTLRAAGRRGPSQTPKGRPSTPPQE